jgi:DNA-binding NtrC family response regulator
MKEKIKVLIVDDDTIIGETLKDIMMAKGFESIFVDSGEKALEAVKKDDFDFVLMDIKMPVMNGVEALKEIKKIRPETTVMMMTGYSVDDLIKEAIREGAYDVARKPLDIDRIIKLIKESQNGVLVMMVDDDQSICTTFKDILEKKGMSLSVAHSGEEAIKKMKENPHDVIFIDIKLPRLNGLETYLELKKINPNVKAVVTTGYKDECQELIEKAKEENIYTCLYKPLDPAATVRLIEELSKKKKSDKP